MKLLLVLFIFISTSALAGPLSTAVDKTKGVFGNNSGNQTIVNVEKPQQEAVASNNTSGAGYVESEVTIIVEFAPYIFPSGSTNRQFAQQTFTVGGLWKINEHFQLVGKWMEYNVKSPDGDEDFKATHYMYGAGWRMSTSQEQQIQINMGSSSSDVKFLDDGEYELPVWAEFKYLWCSNNTAYGIVANVFDMPKKESDNDNFKNAGFISVGLTFEMGLPGFNIQ